MMMMSSHLHHLLALLHLLLLPSAFSATLFLPVFKTTDHARPQYQASVRFGTPPVPATLTLDLKNPYTWLVCDAVGYTHSSTYSSVPCHSSDCSTFADDVVCNDCNDTASPTPTCNLNQCGSLSTNFVTTATELGFLVRDSASLFRRASPSSAPVSATLPRLPISCVPTNKESILGGLYNLTNGVLSLARTPSIAIQYQVSSSFNLPRKFALCLPSSAASGGAVYFGGGPYSPPLVSLPLLVNALNSSLVFRQYDPSINYYVKIASIQIDGSPLNFNYSFLSSFDSNGDGGVQVSTIAPYTQLRPEIYEPFVKLFVAKAKAMNVTTVASPRKEFGACFDPKSIHYDPKTGSGLPVVDLVVEGGGRWRIFGANSVVKAERGPSCLAFVEGRPRKQTATSQVLEVFPAVVIGGAQLEDNLVEFDLDNSKLGVSSSLLRLGTSCSQFKGF